MTTWIVKRRIVSATELGGERPFIPADVEVEAESYAFRAGGKVELVEFRSREGQTVYAVPEDLVREIIRKDGGVTEVTGEEKK